MSHFYGSMQGGRGSVTRTGTKKSGVQAHVHGWDVGVEVFCHVDKKTGKDVCEVYETGGSKSGTWKRKIGEAKEE